MFSLKVQPCQVDTEYTGKRDKDASLGEVGGGLPTETWDWTSWSQDTLCRGRQRPQGPWPGGPTGWSSSCTELVLHSFSVRAHLACGSHNLWCSENDHRPRKQISWILTPRETQEAPVECPLWTRRAGQGHLRASTRGIAHAGRPEGMATGPAKTPFLRTQHSPSVTGLTHRQRHGKHGKHGVTRRISEWPISTRNGV